MPGPRDTPIDPNDVLDITGDRDSHVEVTFADGRACRFELLDLRLACPCATCRNAREQGRAPWRPGADRPFPVIADATLVGAWGLGVTWTDDGEPIVLAVLSTMPAQDAVRDDALVADAARAVAATLTRPAGTA